VPARPSELGVVIPEALKKGLLDLDHCIVM